MRKQFQNLSIKTKMLFSCAVVVLLCILIFSTTVYLSANNFIEQEAQHSVLQTIDLAKENTLFYMDDVENMLFTVQANKQVQSVLISGLESSPDSIQILEDALLSVDTFYKKIASVKLYLPQIPGDYSTQNSGIISPYSIVEKENWFQDTVAAGGTTCWRVFHSIRSNGVISASRLIMDTSTHQPLAVLRMNISIPQFISTLNNIRLGKTGTVFLVNDNHIINATGNSTINEFVNNYDFFNIIQNETVESGFLDLGGSNYMITYKNLNDLHLKIVGAVDCAELNNSARAVAGGIILVALLSLLITFILLFYISKSITDPIYTLADAMQKFDGDSEVYLTVPSENEIGTLYRSFNTMVSTINNLIKDVNMLFEKQKQSELKALQAQINPHFLYNTLDSINWMAKKYHARDISMLATALGNFFRHSLNHGREFTTIENELNQIESYVYIQKLRFKDQFDLNVQVDDEILSCLTIKLSLQPLVENCIVHAFEDIEYKGVIDIYGYRDGDYIMLYVSDNGCGADPDALNRQIEREFSLDEPIEHYGLHNVNQRIKMYFSGNCGLRFETNETGGITVAVKIEYRER